MEVEIQKWMKDAMEKEMFMDNMDFLYKLENCTKKLIWKQTLVNRLLLHPYTDYLREEGVQAFDKNGKRLMELLDVLDYDIVYTGIAHDVVIRAKVSLSKLMFHFKYTRNTNKSSVAEFTLSFSEGYEKPLEMIRLKVISELTYPASLYMDEAREEKVEDFYLDQDVMGKMFGKMNEMEELEFLAPMEVIQMILVMPYHEEEWMMEEKIMDILMDVEEESEPETEFSEDENLG